MNIAALSNNSIPNYLTLSSQQNQQTETQANSTNIGPAATLDLSDAAGGAAVSGSTGSQSGNNGGISAGNTCLLGNSSCNGCGQCGKITATSSASNQQDINNQIKPQLNYSISSAINAYGMVSVYR